MKTSGGARLESGPTATRGLQIATLQREQPVSALAAVRPVLMGLFSKRRAKVCPVPFLSYTSPSITAKMTSAERTILGNTRVRVQSESSGVF